MQSVVVHAGTIEDALASESATHHVKPAGLAKVILPSPSLTSTQRLAIYHSMYPARMRDALRNDYPAFAHFVGDEAFADIAAAYTQVHPSKSYTLNRLGDFFPEFVAERRALKHRPFLTDLARLELAMTQTFDAPEAPVLTGDGLPSLDPATLATARLTVVPSLRLLEVKHNVSDYVSSVRDDDAEHSHPAPKSSPASIAVFRRKYAVYRLEVSPAVFYVLTDLQKGDLTVGEVVTAALRRRGKRAATAADFQRWLATWTSEGILSTLTLH